MKNTNRLFLKITTGLTLLGLAGVTFATAVPTELSINCWGKNCRSLAIQNLSISSQTDKLLNINNLNNIVAHHWLDVAAEGIRAVFNPFQIAPQANDKGSGAITLRYKAQVNGFPGKEITKTFPTTPTGTFADVSNQLPSIWQVNSYSFACFTNSLVRNSVDVISISCFQNKGPVGHSPEFPIG